jgi:hypothetical protein
MDMLNNGVDLVVGSDGGEYFSRDSVNANPFLLYRSLDEMNRGFGESRRKSEMAKSKWQSRREAVAKGEFKPLGSLPWWLENGKDAYVVKPGMRELIKRIFSMYLAGHGSQVIAKKLNREKVRMPTNKDGSLRKNEHGWHGTFILNLIKNRALLGYYFKTEYQILPKVISEETFYRANAKRKERKCFAGRKAEHINPFAGLCFCARCGGHIITHHSGVKKYGKVRYAYFLCGESRRACCSAVGIPCDVFEESFDVVWERKEIAKNFMRVDEKEDSKLTELQGRLAVIDSRLRQVEADYAASPSTPLARIMAKLEAEEATLKKELEAATIAEKGTVATSDAWRDFLDILCEDWDLPETRLRMQECLRNTVERITIDTEKKAYTVYFKGTQETIAVTDLTQYGYKSGGHNYRMTAGVFKYEAGMTDKQVRQELKRLKEKRARDLAKRWSMLPARKRHEEGTRANELFTKPCNPLLPFNFRFRLSPSPRLRLEPWRQEFGGLVVGPVQILNPCRRKTLVALKPKVVVQSVKPMHPIAVGSPVRALALSK